MELKSVMCDVKTQIKIACNANYKVRLMEAYREFMFNRVKSEELLLKSNLKTGNFTYEELSFFDRTNDSEYNSFIQLLAQEMISSYVMAKQNLLLGDQIFNDGIKSR